jgi:AcrR family transcriptional regulator
MPRPRFENLPPEKRERLLETAAKAFAAAGYEGASLNQILADSDVSKGAAYYYFDNKLDLYTTAVRYYLADFLPLDETDLAGLTAVTFWPALQQLYRRQFAQAAERPWLFALLKSSGPLSPDNLAESPLADFWQRISHLLAGILQQGQALGVVRHDLPDELLFALVLALDDAHDRWLRDHLPAATPESLDEAAVRMVDLLQRLLKPGNE